MGKTIALKLTVQDKVMVAQLTKRGMTYSQLLRAALHHYYDGVMNPSSQENTTLVQRCPDSARSIVTSDSVQAVRQELQDIWELIESKQKQVEDHIKSLEKQLSLCSVGCPTSSHRIDTEKPDILHDIHTEIDEFLKKKTES